MATNPLQSALDAYGTITGIQRADREEARRDKEFSLRENEYAWRVKERQEQENIRKWSSAKALIQSGDPEWYNHASPDIVQDMLTQVGNDPRYAHLQDPKERLRVTNAMNTIKAGLGGALPFESAPMLDAVNTVLRPQLMKGTADDGLPALDKRIVAIHPVDESMEDFYLELETTRASDGQKYRAPLTENRSADPNDRVKPVKLEQFIESMHSTEGLVNLINAKMIGLGDQGAMKEIQARQQGRAASRALSAIDPSTPVSQQRQQLFTALTENDVPLGEAASVMGTVIPDQKYIEREVPVDGEDRVVQKQASIDGGRTWQGVGQPMYVDTAYARGQGRVGGDSDLKYDRQLIVADIKDAQKNVYALRQKINSYKANMGKEITSRTEDPLSGEITATKRVVTEADIKGLEDQLQIEQERLDGLMKEARSAAYHTGRRSAISMPGRSAQAPPEYIEKTRTAAQKWNVPFEVVMAVMQTESSFSPGVDNAEFGPESGMGLMQLTEPAIEDVKKLGVNITNPYDPDQAIEGGVAYMKILLDRYGRTPEGVQKAIAAYRGGMDNIDKGIYTPRTKGYLRNVNAAMRSWKGDNPSPAGAGESKKDGIVSSSGSASAQSAQSLAANHTGTKSSHLDAITSNNVDTLIKDGVELRNTGRVSKKTGKPLYEGLANGKKVYWTPDGEGDTDSGIVPP